MRPVGRHVRERLDAKAKAARSLEELARGTSLGLADPARKPLLEWVRREELIHTVRIRIGDTVAANEALDDAIYAPYLIRLEAELSARSRDRRLPIPAHFNFSQVPGLSSEMQERLAAAGPADLDQAARVAGVTPAALSALHFALVRQAA